MASVSKGKLLVGLIVGILIGAVVGYGSALSRIGPLETQVSTLQNQIASDTSTINSLNSQISHLQGQVASREARIASLENQIASDTSTINSLNSQISLMKEELEELRNWVGNASLYFIGELPNTVNEAGYLQRIENLTLSSSVVPSGTKILTDRYGNDYILFYWNQKPTENVRITVECVVFRDVNYRVLNAVSPHSYPLDGDLIPNDIKIYLDLDSPLQSDDPVIIEKAREIAGNLTTQEEVVNAIVSWVHENIQWRCFGEIEEEYNETIVKKYGYFKWTALEVLEYRQGVCGNFADLTISFLKALGIPVRFVFGHIGYPDSPDPESRLYIGADTSYVVYHAWVQVYYPEAGWINYDPVFGIVSLRNWIEILYPPRESIASILFSIFGSGGYCKEEQTQFHEYYLVGLGNNRVKLVYTVMLCVDQLKE